jgi:pyruvate formate lyase activating enzyme
MYIGGLQKTSLIDYNDKLCCVIFTSGCNFGCQYCHNPELLGFDSKIPQYQVVEFLKSKAGVLDGVVITGGEPTLQKDLQKFIQSIKELGFLVKLDSNGSNPQVLQNLINQNLVDYIAMDVKAPFAKYHQVAGTFLPECIYRQSIDIIKESGIDYEFRTTVVKSQLSLDDIMEIAIQVKNAKRYILQKFIPAKTFSPRFATEQTYTDEEFNSIVSKIKAQKIVEECFVR